MLGFASYGAFRAWPAYKYSVEHSIYIRTDSRGRGVGRALLEELIAQARSRDVHTMIGGIDRSNAASVSLHQSMGFVEAGILRQVGFKFGEWLDLAFYQKLLDTPFNPIDG